MLELIWGRVRFTTRPPGDAGDRAHLPWRQLRRECFPRLAKARRNSARPSNPSPTNSDPSFSFGVTSGRRFRNWRDDPLPDRLSQSALTRGSVQFRCFGSLISDCFEFPTGPSP